MSEDPCKIQDRRPANESGPKVFILSSHGSMPMQDTKTATTAFSLPVMGMANIKKVTSFEAPVDTFTTARFGCTFFSDLRCDEPFVDFVREINRQRVAMKTQPTKQQLRKGILIYFFACLVNLHN